MNSVLLVGRLCKDPEIKRTNSDIAVCQFTLAVNRKYRSAAGSTEADFINCVAWREQAENLGKYMRKGSLIGVEGSIQTRNYTDNNGTKKFITEVLASTISFLESKNSQSDRYEQSQTQPSQQPKQEQTYQPPKQSEQFAKQDNTAVDVFDLLKGGFDVSNDDLPF
jgi:single-strand DNA-binding protein